MRITLVEFNPSGGLFQFAFQLGEALAGRGHDVELVTGPDPEFTSSVAGLRVVSLLPTWHAGARDVRSPWHRKAERAGRGIRYAAAWLRLAAYLRAQRPEVVQWASWRFALDGVAVRSVAGALPGTVMADLVHSPRAFVEQHSTARPAEGTEGLFKQGRAFHGALGSAYRCLDVAFVLGERARAELLEQWPTVRRVEVLPHGDEGVFARGAQQPPAGDCPPVALFFGTWTRYKGLDLLLEAFALVRAELPEARLVVAGDVSGDLDVAEVERLAARVGGVELRPGYVPAEDVAPLVGSARVVVLPYRAVFQSGVAHLAQTFARPVVATDVGDLAAVVADGRSGLVVPPADPPALAAAVLRLLRDPATASAYGAAGREDLRRRGSWSDVAATVEAVYLDLVGDLAAGARHTARPRRGSAVRGPRPRPAQNRVPAPAKGRTP